MIDYTNKINLIGLYIKVTNHYYSLRNFRSWEKSYHNYHTKINHWIQILEKNFLIWDYHSVKAGIKVKDFVNKLGLKEEELPSCYQNIKDENTLVLTWVKPYDVKSRQFNYDTDLIDFLSREFTLADFEELSVILVKSRLARNLYSESYISNVKVGYNNRNITYAELRLSYSNYATGIQLAKYVGLILNKLKEVENQEVYVLKIPYVDLKFTDDIAGYQYKIKQFIRKAYGEENPRENFRIVSDKILNIENIPSSQIPAFYNIRLDYFN